MNALKRLLAGAEPVMAPLVFDPISAKLAEAAGFRALYLGGGAMGYIKCGTEANLTLTEMVSAGIEIRTVSRLPLILDAACGWGDPMHVGRTIAMSEAAGFAAIEIEDQVLPKRAHHHIGIEHIIPMELMVAKIAEAVAARRDPDFLIIGRTNARRSVNLDEALHRAEAFHRAGADILFVTTRDPEDLRILGARLPLPLLFMTGPGGLAGSPLAKAELFALGFRLIVDSMTPVLALHKALRACYESLARGQDDPNLGPEAAEEQKRIHETIALEAMLAVERRTVER
jgi:2-methylisocitrate lyase-like PEP mutase family enzyme